MNRVMWRGFSFDGGSGIFDFRPGRESFRHLLLAGQSMHTHKNRSPLLLRGAVQMLVGSPIGIETGDLLAQAAVYARSQTCAGDASRTRHVVAAFGDAIEAGLGGAVIADLDSALWKIASLVEHRQHHAYRTTSVGPPHRGATCLG